MQRDDRLHPQLTLQQDLDRVALLHLEVLRSLVILDTSTVEKQSAN